MSQRAFLQDLDATIMAGMAAAGMADAAVYTAPAGTPVNCDVYVDDAAQFFGDDAAPVAGHRYVVTLLKAQVPAPVRDATVVADGTTYTLDALVEQDQSISRWVVSHG